MIKDRKKKRNTEHLLGLLITLLYAAVFFIVWSRCYLPAMSEPYWWKGKLTLYLCYAAAASLLLEHFGGFDTGVTRVRDVTFAHYSAMLACNLVMYVILIFVNRSVFTPLPLLLVLVIECVMAPLWASLTNRLYYSFYAKQSTVVVCRSESDLERLKRIPYFADKYAVQTTIVSPAGITAVESALDGIECVYIFGVDAALRGAILELCLSMGICTVSVPDISDIIFDCARTTCVGGSIYMEVDGPSVSPVYAFLKRAFDIAASFLALLLLSPLMAVIALCIHGYDKGPAIYRQTRLTRGGKRFTLYKFRSMLINAEKDGVARLAAENDARITPIGHFIRAYRIDELPQLLNILAGDMSFVGPRPERPEIAEIYEGTLPTFHLRLQVKAGLTGYAQVYGRYNSEPYEKLQMDLMYISRMSLFEDLKLIMTTVKILFSKEATEGVEQGQVTAESSTDGSPKN